MRTMSVFRSESSWMSAWMAVMDRVLTMGSARMESTSEGPRISKGSSLILIRTFN